MCDDDYSLVGYTSTFCTDENEWYYPIGNCVYNPPSEYILYFFVVVFTDSVTSLRISLYFKMYHIFCSMFF